jgi:hypothetical protein
MPTIQVLVMVYRYGRTGPSCSTRSTVDSKCDCMSQQQAFQHYHHDRSNLTTTNHGFAIQRHISIGRALDAMNGFDILIVPGGSLEVVNKLARSKSKYISEILLEAVFSR